MGSSKYSSTIIDHLIFCSMFCNLKTIENYDYFGEQL